MSETVIKLENLTKKFGNFTAVNSVNLETIKMIAKILRPNAGKILIQTNHSGLQDLQSVSTTVSQIGFLIDIPNFYNMTGYQLLKYFAKIQRYPKNKIESRIDELLELFKLSEWKHEKVKNYSKGMTQKLGIIQAILHDPVIIILDEPQTGLDPLARIEIRKYIKKLSKLGKTIFVASHMLYEISEVCDKIALINYGKIIGFDTVDNLALTLKTSEINCALLNPLPAEKLAPLLTRMVDRLNPYLDQNLDPNTSEIPIRYNPERQGLKFYFDGKNESKGEILKILVKEFESDFTIVSFIQPRTTQLERVYSQMVMDNTPEGTIKLTGDDS